MVTSEAEGRAARSPAPSSDRNDRAAVGGGLLLTRGSTDPTMWSWLDRCRELAESGLEGIEDPARELADLAAGDRLMMERARRVLHEAHEHEPRNPVLRQMEALWRRAFEKGSWTWGESAADHSPLLS